MPPPKTLSLPLSTVNPGPPEGSDTFGSSAIIAFIETMRNRYRFKFLRKPASLIPRPSRSGEGVCAERRKPACVVCGMDDQYGLEVTVIIPWTEEGTRLWKELRSSGTIPEHAGGQPELNPLNAMVMCVNHSTMFRWYSFYIHVDPKTGKFIFVNLIDNPCQACFHGKAIGLGISDQDAPYPALFQVHEKQAREHHRSISTVPSIPSEIDWQDWLLDWGAVDRDSGLLRRDRPPSDDIPKVLPRLAKVDEDTTMDEDTMDLAELFDPDDFTDEELLAIRDCISACLASRQAL